MEMTLKIIKRTVIVSLCLVTGAMLFGCGSREYKVGGNIKPDSISEFYYTYDNINFNASYQRYYFYVENGKHMFYHETRERLNSYGPTTEDDITLSGRFELTDGEWDTFISCLEKGVVVAREESMAAGDSGPWLYIYWSGDKGKLQQFAFSSQDNQAEFEAFCEELAGK